MESLIGKPIYNSSISSTSRVNVHSRSNCCFISSFQIQMLKHFPDFPSIEVLLDLLYPGQTNAYTHFAHDFPAKWFKIKYYLIKKDFRWQKLLDNVLLQMCLPHKLPNKCIQLTFIDLNKINPEEVSQGNFESLEASFSDVPNHEKTIISILQFNNHFEPVDVDFNSGSTILESLDEVGIDEKFFS